MVWQLHAVLRLGGEGRRAQWIATHGLFKMKFGNSLESPRFVCTAPLALQYSVYRVQSVFLNLFACGYVSSSCQILR